MDVPSYDVALGPGTDPEKPLAHKIDCPYVRMQADLGEPVMTMLDCIGPLPAGIERHSCLEEAGA